MQKLLLVSSYIYTHIQFLCKKYIDFKVLLLHKIIEYKYNNLNIVEGIISLNLSIFCKLII